MEGLPLITTVGVDFYCTGIFDSEMINNDQSYKQGGVSCHQSRIGSYFLTSSGIRMGEIPFDVIT